MSVCPLCRRRSGSLQESKASGRGNAVYRIASGGMWADDASREIKDRVLQGQQTHPPLPACVLHIPRVHVSTEEGNEQTAPAFHMRPAGCDHRCLEANAEGSARVESNSPDACVAYCTGQAIKPNHPRMVELPGVTRRVSRTQARTRDAVPKMGEGLLEPLAGAGGVH